MKQFYFSRLSRVLGIGNEPRVMNKWQNPMQGCAYGMWVDGNSKNSTMHDRR